MAQTYLIKKGYKILNRNFALGHFEIDLIGRDSQGVLVFVEVKTLTYGKLIPEDNLTVSKLKKIRIAAELFVATNSQLILEDAGWRIDLIAIVLQNGKAMDVRHYENI